jgi:signal transduction histidine kinase
VATLAHDLNNLLTPIVALSAGLEQDLRDARLGYDQARDLRIAAERATMFVQRTLLSLRLVTESAVHVGNVVRDMSELLRIVAGTSIVLDVEIAPKTGLALLDRNRLEAVLLDLVSNARAAITDRGTIRLRVSSVKLDADQAAALGCVASNYELVEIQDNGSGIREELQQRVFERHFTTKPGGRGSGLGLTHVRRFVLESRGAIAVKSAPGAGSTFALYFPQLSPAGTR